MFPLWTPNRPLHEGWGFATIKARAALLSRMPSAPPPQGTDSRSPSETPLHPQPRLPCEALSPPWTLPGHLEYFPRALLNLRGLQWEAFWFSVWVPENELSKNKGSVLNRTSPRVTGSSSIPEAGRWRLRRKGRKPKASQQKGRCAGR